VVDRGNDEIAILANALDTGFSAIATRDQERNQFLAVVAHELKTPLTSIQGFASLLVDHRQDAETVDRAIEVIRRQAWRLSRLVEHVFLAIQARASELQFQPEPFDLSHLVRTVISEIKPLVSGQDFKSRIEDNVLLLGDEALLEHAIWSLFTCTSAVSAGKMPLDIDLDSTETRARLTIQVYHSTLSTHDVESLFVPFGGIEFEERSGIRAAIGLYLVREIVRIHNGRLQVFDNAGIGPQFSMELPR
jgi:two-component system, OmpR family, sensor histidine kinase VicK